MNLLGIGNSDTQKNIKRTRQERRRRRQQKLEKKLLSELEGLEEVLLALPTVKRKEAFKNIDSSQFEKDGKRALHVYEFIPSNLGFIEGLILFYDDGSAEINLSTSSWEIISEPLLKEICSWGTGEDGVPGFERSPLNIKEEKYKYAFFFSKQGVSVDAKGKEGYVDVYYLLSAYFAWIYNEFVRENSDSSISSLFLSKDQIIAVERFLTA